MGEHRSGFVAVIGRPNVGKSTLINALLGQKVAIVSDKPQTTRNAIQGVYTRPDLQIVFVDTPGVHKPQHQLGRRMLQSAWSALSEVDAVLFVVDAAASVGGGDRFIAQRLTAAGGTPSPIVMAFNKMDRIQGDWSARRAAYCALIPSAHTIEISASEGRNLDDLIALIDSLMPPGPQYYPEDWVGDHPERFVIAEFIREKVLELTRDEVPHAVAVEVDKIERREDRELVDVYATLFVERETQARILIGKKGAMLHEIGVRARRDIESLLGSQINLQLWVKTRPDWRDSRAALHELGYE